MLTLGDLGIWTWIWEHVLSSIRTNGVLATTNFDRPFFVCHAEIRKLHVHRIIAWFKHLFEDDILGKKTWTLGLWDDTKAYYDAIIHGASAPPGIMRFTGDGSIYDVTVIWKVYN
jgi:hypothetical protein